jgi:hypothetical protein
MPYCEACIPGEGLPTAHCQLMSWQATRINAYLGAPSSASLALRRIEILESIWRTAANREFGLDGGFLFRNCPGEWRRGVKEKTETWGERENGDRG